MKASLWQSVAERGPPAAPRADPGRGRTSRDPVAEAGSPPVPSRRTSRVPSSPPSTKDWGDHGDLAPFPRKVIDFLDRHVTPVLRSAPASYEDLKKMLVELTSAQLNEIRTQLKVELAHRPVNTTTKQQ